MTAATEARLREGAARLGDFVVGPRLLLIAAMAVVLGAVSAVIALVLLRLIDFFTNLFFFGRIGFGPASPADNALGPFVIVVPVIGALLIGLMARYGSDRIRGHGIPEAIEAILIGRSRVEPKVAVLKPLASAISIGSGGPFGAEGPIIMTGGAVGSMAAQFFHLTAAERKTLLVAGAAAGMSATFGTPVAAVLLAVELLLFEWRPRSMIPVALASATAAAIRVPLLGQPPLFVVPRHAADIGLEGLLACLLVGLAAGLLSAALTAAVYAAEDGFARLPVHWMWWPAIGGLVVGVGGFLFPRALGVGYGTIGDLLNGSLAIGTVVGILVVKGVIWSVALGSGTSGGVLAPLLMMGGALGALLALILPNEGVGFWPMIAMAAILGGTMRSPFTGVIFALELTHDVTALLPLLLAVSVAYGVTVLLMKRSILTEKVARRGFHLSREYSVDPLETRFVREVMRTSIVALPRDGELDGLVDARLGSDGTHGQGLFPVIDSDRMVGVLTRGDMTRVREAVREHRDAESLLTQLLHRDPVVAYADETLRIVAERMAASGLTRFPVVERDAPDRIVGIVALRHLLTARAHAVEEEQQRERTLRLRFLLPRRRRGPKDGPRSA
ncbi:MAG: chloride channel protein [Chloroflexota bacterium]